MRVVGIVFLTILLWAGSIPALAQAVFGGGALSIGIREGEERIGIQNFVSEVRYTEDGKTPINQEAPYIQESNDERLALPNHVPGFPGKVWLLIKSSLVNAKEIKSIQLSFRRDNRPGSLVVVEGELCGNQADFWIDMSQFGAGSYPMEVKVIHMGGEVTYQVLFFILRKKKEVQDSAVYYFTVYNPERTYTPGEYELGKYLRGYEPGESGKAFRLNTGKDKPVTLTQPMQDRSSMPQPQMATVNLSVFSNKSHTQPCEGSFRLVSEDKSFRTELIAGTTIRFVVPMDKRYKVYTNQAGRWQPYRCPDWFSVSPKQPTEIIIEPREVR